MRIPRSISVALAGCALALTVVPAASDPAPILIAHRGGAGLWPENTMGAFRNAHQLFAEANVPGWIELDVRITADQVLVVIHDATLDRTTNCTGTVAEMSSADVTQCDADPDTLNVDMIPTVAEVLDEGQDAGWRLVIEIKDIVGEPGFDVDCNEWTDALVAAVDAASFPREDLIVESFWPLCLERLETTSPDIATLLLTSSTSINDITGMDTPVPLGFTLAENALFATLRNYEYSSPDQDAPDLIAPVVDAAHLLGRQVIVWTVDDGARMSELAAIGVDGIISNRPDLLIAALAS